MCVAAFHVGLQEKLDELGNIAVSRQEVSIKQGILSFRIKKNVELS